LGGKKSSDPPGQSAFTPQEVWGAGEIELSRGGRVYGNRL